MLIKKTFSGQRFRAMLMTASISVCAEIANVFVDKIVAAQFLGEKALASISFFSPLFSFIFFLNALVAVGSLACYSIELGRMNRDRANRFFGQSILLSFLVGTLMVILFAFGKGIMFRFMNVDPELLQYVNEFYIWFLGIAFFMPFCNVLQEMIFADGDTRICNASYAVLLGGNVVLSCLFCTRMGMSGIALGTLLSVVLSIAVLCVHFFRKSNSLRFVWHFKIADVAWTFRFSMAEACEYFYFSLLAALLNFYFVLHFGTDKLTVLSIVYEIVEVSVIFNGVWLAAEPLINIYRGERNGKGILQTMRFVNWSILKEGVLITAFLLIFAPAMTQLFGIQSESLAGEATFAIRACAVGLFPLAVVKTYACYHVHELPLLSFLFISLVMFVCPFFSVVGLHVLFGDGALWIGFGVAPFAALALSAGVQLLIHGREHFPLELEEFTIGNFWHMHDMELNPRNIIAYRNKFSKLLTRRGVSGDLRIKAMLILEELGMVIYERNKGKKIFVEIDVNLKPDNLTVVIKDDGVLMDLTDFEQRVTDLRMYLVNMFMTVQEDKCYLLTSSYNRHVFRFDRN